MSTNFHLGFASTKDINLHLGFASMADSECEMCKKKFRFVYQPYRYEVNYFVCKTCFKGIEK